MGGTSLQFPTNCIVASGGDFTSGTIPSYTFRWPESVPLASALAVKYLSILTRMEYIFMSSVEDVDLFISESFRAG